MKFDLSSFETRRTSSCTRHFFADVSQQETCSLLMQTSFHNRPLHIARTIGPSHGGFQSITMAQVFNSFAVRHVRALLMGFSSTGEHICHTEQFRKTHAFGDRLAAREAMTGMHAIFIRTWPTRTNHTEDGSLFR
jgi:hypothetical protein